MYPFVYLTHINLTVFFATYKLLSQIEVFYANAKTEFLVADIY